MTTITYPNGTLLVADTTTPTKNTTITEDNVIVQGLSFGTQYTNTITPTLTTISNPTGTLKTEYGLGLIDATYLSSNTTYSYNLRTESQQEGKLIFTTTPPSPAPATQTIYSTNGLFSNRTAGYDITISKLKLNDNNSTEGQVITADANGKPIWTTPQPIVSTLEYYITATSPFFQYPPVAPTQALITSYQYYGWYFINSVALRKIDWFFAPDYAMTVADVKGLYLNYFNITTTSNDNLPFLTIYTKPTGNNDIIPGFAHSSATYIANFTPTAATPYCSFMNISGVQPDPFPYGHQLGAMILSPIQPNPRGEYLGTEEVLAVAVGTNSASTVGQCNFIFQKLGICLEQGNAELVLNPQNILDINATTLTTTTSVKPTTILDKDNQAGTAGQLLSSTATGIDWVDAPTSGWVGTATSNLDMDNYSVVDVNNIGMVNGTLSASSSTVATDTATLTNTGVTVGTTVLGSTYTNTITGDEILMETPTNSRRTEIVPAVVDMSQTNSGIFSRIVTGYNPSPNIGLQSSSTNVPPDFPAQNCTLSTSGLSANNSFGWNLDVPKLLLNYGASTTGQVITADANGRPVWGSPATPYISATGVASGGITSLPSIDASGTLLLGTNSATTAITVGSSSATELLLVPPLKVGTLGNAGLAGQYLTSSSGSANTWTTPYVNASNGQVAGNLLLQGNNISGINNIDGNSASLRIGTLTGTTSVLIGRAGIPVDIANTIRCGPDGSLSPGTAGQVITSQGAGLPTVYKFPTLASLQNPITFSGQGFAAGANNFSYNRTVITAPNVGAKYLFFLTTTINSNNSGNIQNAFVSLAYTDGDTNVTPSNGFNMVNGLTTAGGNVLTATTAMAVVRSGTTTTTTQTVSPTWIYTWAGALTKSFAMVNCGGPDFSIGHGRISYIQIS
jgi:hypothetical protein